MVTCVATKLEPVPVTWGRQTKRRVSSCGAEGKKGPRANVNLGRERASAVGVDLRKSTSKSVAGPRSERAAARSSTHLMDGHGDWIQTRRDQ